MKKEVRLTEDGSYTFYITDLHESYHSVHGAIQEARHVYINAALNYAMASFQTVHLLEIGFGTGLNALLSLLEAENQKVDIYYCGIEAFPLTDHEIRIMNYPEILKIDEELFFDLHQAPFGSEYIPITQFFHFKKIHTTLQESVLSQNYFNTVYFDAFAPSIQPELWEKSIFEKIFHAMCSQGVLTTYSVKGAVRRAMQEIGFQTTLLPGPIGKREMLRGIKP